MAAATDLCDYEVSMKPDVTLEAAIEAGEIPAPELMRFQGGWHGVEETARDPLGRTATRQVRT